MKGQMIDMTTKKKSPTATTSAFPDSRRLISTDPSVRKTFKRLSRSSLLDLVFVWLEDDARKSLKPRLGTEDVEQDPLYTPANTLEELRQVYRELQEHKGGKRDVVDRILEGDWKHGVSLQQLAMTDVQYLLDRPNSQRWTALKLVNAITEPRLGKLAESSASRDALGSLPRFNGPTFIRKLQNEIGSIFKCHYYISRIESLSITLLRIQVHETLFLSTHRNKSSSVPNSIIYVAIPDYSLFVFVSLTTRSSNATASKANAMRNLVIDALPRAFSKPKERYRFQATSLTVKSLSALSAVQAVREAATNGGWSIFADGSADNSPLRVLSSEHNFNGLLYRSEIGLPEDEGILTERPQNKREAEPAAHDGPLEKRQKKLAQARFGVSALEDDNKGIKKLDIQLQDPFPEAPAVQDESNVITEQDPPSEHDAPTQQRHSSLFSEDGLEANDSFDEDAEPSSGWTPKVRLSFRGSHVFAGIRKLIEVGAVDGERMPGWMTGEDGVDAGTVRKGRMVRTKVV